MKKTLYVGTLLALLTLSLSVFAQNRSERPRHDQPMISGRDVVTNIATTPYSGVLVYNFTILNSTPTVNPVTCSVSTYVSGDTSGRQFYETAYGRATPISGGYAKCTVKIYYTWQLASAGSDMITGSANFSANTAATAGTTQRSAQQSLVSIPVPATGVTTTTTLSGRL
ncbi:hypothetical protein Acid345_0541 [Candidatus Koribacter versatilis Ellin345]|uniref:DUF11 domain-containing protein n=1 Tax=Koribacter versatilis (strain Ellin345) TaxID=204669 RepID=Q1IUA4_KORVE|nr:hypothetical protein [Candidatus Koribacter versatilis]ABF39546.1 hypothetical protein Acid345_0541 [Candidatus Koribacter versatilis Ellin345]